MDNNDCYFMFLLECKDSLVGAISGVNGIPNSAMTASSNHSSHPPHYGRLLADTWWMPVKHDHSQFLRVDLIHLAVIRKSAVQGSGVSTPAGARVIAYFLYHSFDEDIWYPVLAKENPRVW